MNRIKNKYFVSRASHRLNNFASACAKDLIRKERNMGEFTSTNEETLINHLNKLEKHEVIELVPRDNWINIYVIPASMENFHSLADNEKDTYWKGSVAAIALHKDVWTSNLSRAVCYR